MKTKKQKRIADQLVNNIDLLVVKNNKNTQSLIYDEYVDVEKIINLYRYFNDLDDEFFTRINEIYPNAMKKYTYEASKYIVNNFDDIKKEKEEKIILMYEMAKSNIEKIDFENKCKENSEKLNLTDSDKNEVDQILKQRPFIGTKWGLCEYRFKDLILNPDTKNILENGFCGPFDFELHNRLKNVDVFKFYLNSDDCSICIIYGDNEEISWDGESDLDFHNKWIIKYFKNFNFTEFKIK